MKPGDEVRVKVAGVIFTGRVRYANESFISVDEGKGVTAIIRYDIHSHKWLMGKRPAEVEVIGGESLSDKLNRLAKIADEVLKGENNAPKRTRKRSTYAR